MKYSIIAIGDELLIGQVIDTNSGYIERYMAPYGWEALLTQVVHDDAEQIRHAIDVAFEQTDCVLMTGGLGPTKDDITKGTLCDYFGGTLVYDNDVARNVEHVMTERHLQVNEYTRTQAMVPSSCRVIQNEVGTAPLMWFERDGKVLVSMPGVPHETQTMLGRAVAPQLLQRFNDGEALAFRTAIITGITESDLAMRLDEYERQLPASLHLAYLPQPGIVRLRLTGNANDAAQLNELIDKQFQSLVEQVGDLVIATEDITLPAILGNHLRERHLTLATAESCTGGNIAHQITTIAGSSDYFLGSVVSYANSVKTGLLGVDPRDIERHGAVSREVVEQMAAGACAAMHADCAIATSGIAGPTGGTKEKPVGTVWMAARCGDKTKSIVRQFAGDRARVIDRATTEAQLLLLRLLVSV